MSKIGLRTAAQLANVEFKWFYARNMYHAPAPWLRSVLFLFGGGTSKHHVCRRRCADARNMQRTGGDCSLAGRPRLQCFRPPGWALVISRQPQVDRRELIGENCCSNHVKSKQIAAATNVAHQDRWVHRSRLILSDAGWHSFSSRDSELACVPNCQSLYLPLPVILPPSFYSYLSPSLTPTLLLVHSLTLCPLPILHYRWLLDSRTALFPPGRHRGAVVVFDI